MGCKRVNGLVTEKAAAFAMGISVKTFRRRSVDEQQIGMIKAGVDASKRGAKFLQLLDLDQGENSEVDK